MANPHSVPLRVMFGRTDLSIERFIEGCVLIYENRDIISSSEMLVVSSSFSEYTFRSVLAILDHQGLVDLKGRDYVILATDTEFQVGLGRIMKNLFSIDYNDIRLSWSIEDKMVLVKDMGTTRFSVSIFFRWCEIFLHEMTKQLFITKKKLLSNFSLMTESRNDYCIRILQQQELIIDTIMGIFLVEDIFDISEWFDNLQQDYKQGFDLGT